MNKAVAGLASQIPEKYLAPLFSSVVNDYLLFIENPDIATMARLGWNERLIIKYEA